MNIVGRFTSQTAVRERFPRALPHMAKVKEVTVKSTLNLGCLLSGTYHVASHKLYFTYVEPNYEPNLTLLHLACTVYKEIPPRF